MAIFAYLLLAILVSEPIQEVPNTRYPGITIVDTGKQVPVITQLKNGTVAEFAVANHYIPGMRYFNAGRYGWAEAEFTYVINTPQYLEADSRATEVMSTAY